VSEPDLSRLDELELLNVSDEDEADGQTDEAASQHAGGAFGRVGRLASVLAAPFASRLGASFASGPARRLVASPAGHLAGSLASRVPAAVLAGALGFAGVLVVTLIGAALLGGGQPVEASVPAGQVEHASGSTAEADLANEPPHPTQGVPGTRTGPTPTPAPRTFQEQDGGWLAIGRVMPEPRHRLQPDQMLFLDDQRESYTIATTLTVLMRSGSLAPLWGIVLGYQDEANHLRLEFFSDSYDRHRPYAGLFLTRNGQHKTIGPTFRLSGVDFWGRDKHRVAVEVRHPEIIATIDGQPLGRWRYQDPLPPPRKALYLWGSSRIRFDSVEIE
jgi:hypothetical protein